MMKIITWHTTEETEDARQGFFIPEPGSQDVDQCEKL